MAWQQLRIALHSRDTAAIESLLTGLGAMAVTLEDAGEQALLEPPPGATPLWDRVGLSALFETGVERTPIERALRAAGIADHAWERLEDRAWERVWLDDFEPRAFGRLWVCPHGQMPDDPEAPVVHLDPGLAFGTGRHATTALCLEWLGAAQLDGCTVIDYGCGSGILAIAAVRLGAREAVAIDIDPQALDATSANAQANGVSAQIETLTPPAATGLHGNIVVANILANTLDELAPTLAAALAAGGRIVLSGILDTQADAVADRYSRWFDMDPPVCRAGWARLTGRR